MVRNALQVALAAVGIYCVSNTIDRHHCISTLSVRMATQDFGPKMFRNDILQFVLIVTISNIIVLSFSSLVCGIIDWNAFEL